MKPISIYIHWPFCTKKCPYCDFNSFVTDAIDHKKWAEAYLKVIKEYYRDYLSDSRIKTVFFGGGTPSLATPNMIESILSALGVDDSIEITLEANPTSVESEKFAEFRKAGINRVSMGIQSLDDENLRFLGRNHSSAESLAAIDTVKKHFDNYSLDFIYGLPHQKLDEWEKELKRAISLASVHLSLYQLTIENGTKFGAMAKQGLLKEIDEDIAADMFELTHQITKDNGFMRYEVSNHAKKGYESQHNLNYWRYGDYLGIGPGAHGRITVDGQKAMTIDIKQPELWLKSVMYNSHGVDIKNILSEEDVRIEKIMTGLRTTEGINIELFNNKDAIDDLTKDGLISLNKDRIVATDRGLVLLNSVTGKLLSDHRSS